MVIRFEPANYVGVAADAPLTPTTRTAPKPLLETSYGGVTAEGVLKAPTTEELSSRAGPDQVRLSNPTDAEAQANLQAALKEAIERGTELALNPNGVTGASGANNAGRAKVTTKTASLKSKTDASKSAPGQADPIKSAKDAALEDMFLKILAHQRQNERREQAGEAKKTTLKG